MALPTGLLPVLAFVLTVGTALPVTIGAHLLARTRGAPFGTALRTVLLAWGGLYLLGVIAVWAFAGVSAWEVAATLVLAGSGAAVFLGSLPLLVGRRLLLVASDVDADCAVRFATYGWPVAMLVVFGVFVAPGGSLFALGSPRGCLLGICGISAPLVAAVLLEALVALLGPWLVGLVLLRARGA